MASKQHESSASRRRKHSDDPPPEEAKRELLGMMPGSDLYDKNGELNQAATDAFAEELNRRLNETRRNEPA